MPRRPKGLIEAIVCLVWMIGDLLWMSGVGLHAAVSLLFLVACAYGLTAIFRLNGKQSEDLSSASAACWAIANGFWAARDLYPSIETWSLVHPMLVGVVFMAASAYFFSKERKEN